MQYKHSVPIQLRFNDLDGFGHVNNSIYLSFYDLGKTNYLNAVFGSEVPLTSISIVIAHIEVDFFSPIFLNDNVAVQSRVSEIGNKSFKLEQQIIDVNTEEVKCSCTSVMVGFDMKTNLAKELDEKWIEAVETYEGRKLKKQN